MRLSLLRPLPRASAAAIHVPGRRRSNRRRGRGGYRWSSAVGARRTCVGLFRAGTARSAFLDRWRAPAGSSAAGQPRQAPLLPEGPSRGSAPPPALPSLSWVAWLLWRPRYPTNPLLPTQRRRRRGASRRPNPPTPPRSQWRRAGLPETAIPPRAAALLYRKRAPETWVI